LQRLLKGLEDGSCDEWKEDKGQGCHHHGVVVDVLEIAPQMERRPALSAEVTLEKSFAELQISRP
jgi:hypothetical protein